MLKPEIKTQLKNFFHSTSQLKQNEIIRSSNYTGDIAEYLCKEIYELDLCKSQREECYDATKNDLLYQIKINNSSQKTNQIIGNPNKYDFLLLLITAESKLFNPIYNEYFMAIYRINSDELKNKSSFAKNWIDTLTPEYLVTNNFDIIKN